MKKLAFVETENTNNETIEKLKIANDIRRHIFEDDNAYAAYKELAEKFNEFEAVAEKAAKDKKDAEKLERANAKREIDVDERIAKIDADFDREMDELKQKFALENNIFNKMVTALNRGQTEEANQLYLELKALEEG